MDDSGGTQAYRRVERLKGSAAELQHGKRLKLKGFPKDHKVQCFRIVVSFHRTDYIVTNDDTQTSTKLVKFTDYRNILWAQGVFILEKGELEDYQTEEGRQLPGGKEEKVINIIRGSGPETGIDLSQFLDVSDFETFLKKLIYSQSIKAQTNFTS